MVDKQETIKLIQLEFKNWDEFYEGVMRNRALDGTVRIGSQCWFVAFDGDATCDMYLCSKDPRGDDEGETITANDCFKPKNLKFKINGKMYERVGSNNLCSRCDLYKNKICTNTLPATSFPACTTSCGLYTFKEIK